jgi:hypothetical protein
MEAVALFLAAWWAAQWLDNNYPQNFSWMLVTVGFATLVLVHSWYVIFKLILKTSQKDSSGSGSGGSSFGG